MIRNKIAAPVLFFAGFLFAANTAVAQENIPQATIDNGLVKLTTYLPDGENGYYRGTRFDWSGVIPSVEYDGHQYHGQWFEQYNPTTHDAVMGPVEEFDPVGYDEAAPGQPFVKIGVGALTKPEEGSYSPFKPYTIANPGKWKVKKTGSQVVYTHTLKEGPYAYKYQKTVRLTKGKPELVLIHTLKNTGTQPIRTRAYDHNFFVIDGHPTGPGYEITFPSVRLSPEGNKGLGTVVNIDGSKIEYLRTLDAGEQGYFPDLASGVEVPYEFRVEHTTSGAGVKVTADRPISQLVFWSNPATVCPEPYMEINVAPGETFSWQITYEYYSIRN